MYPIKKTWSAALWLVLFTLSSMTAVDVAGQKALSSRSKKAVAAYENGLRNYSLRNFEEAEKNFQYALETDPNFVESFLVLAELYEDTGQPLKAIEMYSRAVRLNDTFYPAAHLKLGNLEFREGKYENARNHYENFVLLSPQGENAQIAREGLAKCHFALNEMDHPVDYHPIRLGPSVNTLEDEYWPSISTDEKILVITRAVPCNDCKEKFQEDFFISVALDSGWSEMRNAGPPLNTMQNEGAQTLTGDGRLMVFTACNRQDGFGRCDLYYSERKGDAWTTPRNLGKPVNTGHRETQPSISADGNTLYFSSDRPGGKGAHDLWVSYRDVKGFWSSAQNLGDSINTPGIEMSPFIHPDNQTLYFASDGHQGMGGYDLFLAKKDSAGWSKPRNLGFPINTHRDEIGLVVNARGHKAYFSSDLHKTSGKDIYMFDLPFQDRPAAVTYMKGRVFDAETSQWLKASIELIDLESGDTFFRASSDTLTGEFLVSIPTNHIYLLNISKQGYLFFSENFNMVETFFPSHPYLKDIPLRPIKSGNKMVLKNVFFATDSFALKPESTLELQKVVSLMLSNPNIRIEVSGHTDDRGTAEHNQVLSENRALSVVKYLTDAGIQPSRMVAKGYGMKVPVLSNTTEEGRAQNRRTEITIIP
jgi:hypothetical protein